LVFAYFDEERWLVCCLSRDLSVDEKRSIAQRYNSRRENMLDILLDLQRACPEGFIDEETARWVAQELKITETKVFEALSFYSMLHTQPQARFVFEICSSAPCFFTKAKWVADILCRELGLAEEERISEDGRYAFRFVPCFGACAEGPALRLGDKVYGNLTEESIREIVEKCREPV
jgi:NADH-quinone oxidoreductase subunit E